MAEKDNFVWPFRDVSQAGGREFIRNSLAVLGSKHHIYCDSDFFSFKTKVKSDGLKRRLPLMLRPAADRDAIVFFVHHKHPAWQVAYFEVSVFVKVVSTFGTGYFFMWSVVDNDYALILGRDTLGIPKKMADFALGKDHLLDLTVSRHQETLWRIKADKAEVHFEPHSILGNRIYTVGGPGQLVFFNPIWVYRSREVVHERRPLRIQVSAGRNPYDQLHEWLELGQSEFNGQYMRVSIPTGGYLVPVGCAGPWWAGRTWPMRNI